METFLLIFNFCAFFFLTKPKLHQWCSSNLMLYFLYILALYRQYIILCHVAQKMLA